MSAWNELIADMDIDDNQVSINAGKIGELEYIVQDIQEDLRRIAQLLSHERHAYTDEIINPERLRTEMGQIIPAIQQSLNDLKDLADLS